MWQWVEGPGEHWGHCWSGPVVSREYHTVFRMYGCNIELTPGSTVHDTRTGSVGSEQMMDATG